MSNQNNRCVHCRQFVYQAEIHSKEDCIDNLVALLETAENQIKKLNDQTEDLRWEAYTALTHGD